MDGLTIIEGFFHHISFNDLKRELDFNYYDCFKRCVKRCDDINIINSGPVMKQIIAELAENLDVRPIGYFANYYRDGNHYAPYHRDSYGQNTLTISFGCNRDFCFKADGQPASKYVIRHGDVVMFTQELNRTHKHSIPKRKRLTKDRISILFFY